MTHRLTFIRETPLARLYENKVGARQWIPRSLCVNTLKWPPGPSGTAVHEVEIADWFFEAHPWSRSERDQKELLE